MRRQRMRPPRRAHTDLDDNQDVRQSPSDGAREAVVETPPVVGPRASRRMRNRGARSQCDPEDAPPVVSVRSSRRGAQRSLSDGPGGKQWRTPSTSMQQDASVCSMRSSRSGAQRSLSDGPRRPPGRTRSNLSQQERDDDAHGDSSDELPASASQCGGPNAWQGVEWLDGTPTNSTYKTQVSNVTALMQQEMRKTTMKAKEEMAKPAAPPKTASIWQGTPKAQIILTHKSPHTMDCEKACMKHIHFLIRVLPYGSITPVAVPALANIQRRYQEQFCLKTFYHFEDLRDQLASTCANTHSKSWGKIHSLTQLPLLPVATIPAMGCWERMCIGNKHNPDLEMELQRFLDSLLMQMPSLAEDSVVKSFFEADRITLAHPLVQQVMKDLGGDFPKI